MGRFVNSDDSAYITANTNVTALNFYSYCENDPINDQDNSGAFSWKKILGIFEKIGNFAKKILNCIIDGAATIIGIKSSLSRKDISNIAKIVKRSPHRVKQNFEWLYDKVKKLKTKAGRIFKAVVVILFLSSVASSINKVKTTVTAIIKTIVSAISDGLSALISWLVSKGIRLLSNIIPALGGVLGFLLGELIGSIVDAFLDKYSSSIANNYAKKVNIYKFTIGDYLTTFLKCLV